MEGQQGRRRVVVLGGGYAGVRAARDLARAGAESEVEIELISKSAWHVDLTLMYEVATAYLTSESVASSEIIAASAAVPLAEIFAKLPVKLRISGAERILLKENLIVLSDESTVSYDVLIVALGARLATHGLPGVATNAFSIKELSSALELRHHIVRQFYAAKNLVGAARRQSLTFMVVGAGSAGVEMAAELACHVRHQCSRHRIDPQEISIQLVEAGREILPGISPALQRVAANRLRKLAVVVRLNERVSAIEATAVVFESGETIPTNTAVWTAGLSPHELLVQAGFPVRSWGVVCEPTLQVQGLATVFVAGDAANLQEMKPPLKANVPVAYTQGTLVARNVLRLLRNQRLLTYQRPKEVTVITTGGRTAVLQVGQLKLSGFLPWFLRRLITLRYWLWYLPFIAALRFWFASNRLHGAND